MRVIQITVGGSMRLGKTLNRKEQSRHQNHEGFYERVSRHSVSLFYHIALRNRLNTAASDMFQKYIVFATGYYSGILKKFSARDRGKSGSLERPQRLSLLKRFGVKPQRPQSGSL